MTTDKKKGLNLVSQEEAEYADYLKRRFLDRTNRNSDEVHPKVNFYSRYGKRILDLLISIPVFTLLIPLNMVFCICTFFDVGRPVLYKQKRCGKDGKPFTMVKFRNMNEKRDSEGNLLPAKERVTRLGRFMRKYSLDELLNLWNVITGEMSIIGPRPLPVFFSDRMSERHKMRHAVTPGLECPRMIKLDEDEVGYYQVQYENDIWYVENISLWTDIRMMFALVKMVFNISERGKHADVGTYFVGYNEEGVALSLRLAKEQYPNMNADRENDKGSGSLQDR